VKAIVRALLIFCVLTFVAACGEVTGQSPLPTETTAQTEPADQEMRATPTTAAAQPTATTAQGGAEPTLPPLPEVVPAEPTPTQAAGGKPTLIFFTAPN
jgi:hypothetical protein